MTKLYKIVAVLATHQREQLLFDRALPSILSQSRPASEIILVEDIPIEDILIKDRDKDRGVSKAGKTKTLAGRLAKAAPDAQYLRNRRTPGLSGALNTGLDHLARNHPDPSEVFVAFLDDDDAWMPNHLAEIESRIRKGAEVIATPFLRIEPDREAQRIDPPDSITPEMFMAGNPGIQGSNLAVRLDILLEAGMFNEALPSCTDRELMVRLCRRPKLRFATTSTPSSAHHACPDRPRLSQPGSTAKNNGLGWFDRILGPLMPPAIRHSHLTRAKQLFDWQPVCAETEILSASLPPASLPMAPLPFATSSEMETLADEETNEKTADETETPPLLIGIIVDDRRLESISALLDDIADRVTAEGLATPDLLLLENRPEAESGAGLQRVVAQHREWLRIRVIDRGAINRLARSGEWQQEGSDTSGRLAIADSRTLLQAHLYQMALERPGCVIWILDDDMRLDPLVATKAGSMPQPLALGKALRRMKATGADICIGEYTGAPPVPAMVSVRGQLLDLIWNLRRLSALPADAPLPASEPHNATLREDRRDFFYDLSRIETDRLETPFALEAAHPDETCGEALRRLGAMIPRILAGEAPLRPLQADPAKMEAFEIGDALHRGGNTFVLDPEALADLPNVSPTVNGRPTRRSDMIWSLMQVQRCGRKVVSVPVPVRQDRSHLPTPQQLDHLGIADDIRGYAIFSSFFSVWEEAKDDLNDIEKLCAKFEEERLAALRLSFHRVRGLGRELLAWCQNEAPPHVPCDDLAAQAMKLIRLFSAENFKQIEEAVPALGPAEVQAFVSGLDERVTDHARWVRDSREMPRLLAEERRAAALAAITAEVNPEGPIRLLGQGSEGVVATDGHRIWKLFDGWNREQAARAVPVLQRLVDSPVPYSPVYGGTLIRPLAMTLTPTGWLLTMPFEPTEEWGGGMGPGLVELLADLHRAGLVCRNLHPKNLRRTGDAVRLIDYGADLQPLLDPCFTSLEFQRMCRRAWLCWRW